MRHDCDVLVVGLGPVGDVLAALARLNGLSVIAIDREPDVYPLPRAAVFSADIMRVFQMAGVAERIEPLCRIPDRYQFLTAKREVLLDFPVAPITEHGWAGVYALHQPAVERVLRTRLKELDVVMRLDTEFAGLVQDLDGVTVTTRSSDGSQGRIRARYVVGCDGARSAVREALGIGLFDYAFDEPWLVIDTFIEDPGDLPAVAQQICDPQRPVTHIAMGGKRFRWKFMLKPGETPSDMLADEQIRALLAPWDCIDRAVIERKAIYRFHGLVANQWRTGRVLLAGDAAHQMPPFAGQGLCSGVRDSVNLAWKLGAVIAGEADPSILDSYQIEREPHVRYIIETAIAMGRVVCMLDPAAASARDAEMLARRESGEQSVSIDYPDLKGGLLTDTPQAGALFLQPVVEGRRLDDMLARCAWLIGRDLPSALPPGVRAIDLGDPAAENFATSIAGWLEAAGAQAVLVRPDRYVFGTGQPAALLSLWGQALRPN